MNLLHALCRRLKGKRPPFNALILKRIIRSAASLTICTALILASPTSRFLGQNSFLMGTAAIYLFPKSTVGSQLLLSAISYFGFLGGVIWFNIVSHIAVHVPETTGKRIWIFSMFCLGAFMCGFTRSRHPLAYLGINFFMIVQIFGLVDAIEYDRHTIRPFTDYFYVFTFGTLIAFACSLLWPENSARTIEANLLGCLNAATDLVQSHSSGAQEGKSRFAGVKAFNAKLVASVESTKYEIVYAQISPQIMHLIYADAADLINKLYVLDKVMADLSSGAPIPDGQELHFEQLLADMALLHDWLLRAIVHNMQDAINGRKQDLEGRFTNDLEQHLRKCQQALANLSSLTDETLESRAIKDQAIHAAFEVAKNLLFMYSHSVNAAQNSSRRRRLFWPLALNLKIPLPKVEQPRLWRYWIAHQASEFRDSQHTAYAIKFTLVMALLSIWPFISDFRIWYRDVRGHWSMISAMVVMEVTRGLVFRSALMKGAGAVLGGFLALALFLISAEVLASILLTIPCALFVYYIALHPRFGKMGLVAALAYNLVLKQGYTNEEPYLAYLKRTATLVAGIAVAAAVHILVFPYHARRVLKEEISLGLDALASGFHELSYDADYVSERKDVVSHLNAAMALTNMTHWEPSLKGAFPKALYNDILICAYQLEDLLTYAQRSESCDEDSEVNSVRNEVMMSMANDLYLLSHAIQTKSASLVNLATNLPVSLMRYRALLAIPSYKDSFMEGGEQLESASFLYVCMLMSASMANAARLILEAISGRHLPDLIQAVSSSSLPSPRLSAHKPTMMQVSLSASPSERDISGMRLQLPEAQVSAEEREVIATRSRRNSIGGRKRGSNASFLSTLQLPRLEQGMVAVAADLQPRVDQAESQAVFEGRAIHARQSRRPSIVIQLPTEIRDSAYHVRR